MEIVDTSYTTLRAIGKDEAWVHNWITEKPSRLGLGEIEIRHSAEVVNDCEPPTRCIYCSALALGGAAVAG